MQTLQKKINIPFAIYGVIPTYVREDKIALLLDAGLNRIRMGIQSGSENILEFYNSLHQCYFVLISTNQL